MSRDNYKRIGDYIELVDERNKKLQVTILLGLSISKEFIPSVANTVGTNMSNYKIIRKNQFACSLMQVRRDKKIPVALQQKYNEAIISQAYPVFQVINEDELLPEYLMMWMSRSEFDRHACFLAVGGVRGSLEWEDFLDIELPIPSIEKQREIVKEYNTIVNRIKLNEQLNQKLEETAQALYKHWFVDFEFPDENGKPYKSSGGKMVFNAELEKEIPEGWASGKFDEYVRLSQGQVINSKTNHLIVEKGLPLLRITDLLNDTQKLFIDEKLVSPKNIALREDIIYSRTGQVGLVFRNKTGVVYNNCFKVIPTKESVSSDYIFRLLKDKDIFNLMIELAAGSAQSDLSHSAFFSVSILMPAHKIQLDFSELIKRIEKYQEGNKLQILKLTQFKYLLLSKMTKVELEQSGNRRSQTEKEVV